MFNLLLSISSDIKYGVLDIFRGLGMAVVNLIYSTIDILYDVAQKVNSLNFIEMLQNLENSPFTKIFNAFFILSFVILMFFSIWKITFKIFDAENNEQPLFEIVKEIVKCGVLIFSIYLIFSTSINIGINLSNAIYGNFTEDKATIGDKMKTAYLTANDACFKTKDKNDHDEDNVKDVKEYLDGYANTDSVKTMKDFEGLIRSGKLTATNISDSGAFSYRCSIYKPGFFNDSEDYAFNYNFLFGIVVGAIFLVSIGFAVLMLGRRQLELAFLMTISPLVIASSVGRKEQRSALYQQLTSLVLQAGAMMLLIGLTSIMFNAIQNSADINSMNYATKTVTQSILYLGCAMLLMTGCTSLNRFIGDNVSANGGRDAMLALSGLKTGLFGGFGIAGKTFNTAKGVASGTKQAAKGVKNFGEGAFQVANGVAQGVASVMPQTHKGISNFMNNKLGKGINKVARGAELQESKNPIARMYGKSLANRGENMVKNANSKWNFQNDRYNPEYVKGGLNLAKKGISNIKTGFGTATNSVGALLSPRYAVKRNRIANYARESESI